MPLPQDSSSGSVLGTPLPQNSSSGTEPTVLSATNGDLATGDSEHSNAAFEKPHPLTDIENKLLVESGKVRGTSTSSTTEYPNELHALHPSGGGNVIPPTAQSVMLVDPIPGDIQTPTSIAKLTNETIPAVVAESSSAAEHVQHGKDSTAPKAEKDASVVSIKKKDFLNGSANKKPLKAISEISNTQGEAEQLITDKSMISLYEKKTADKLQKFDKDNSKKMDKIGFVALPVSVEESDPTEDLNVSTATKEVSTPPLSVPGGKSMTEASGSEEEESRPVDEEDENEDPLVHLRSDVEHVNVVEANIMAKKEKKSDAQRTKASRYEGEMGMNETLGVADDEQVVVRGDAMEPAIGVGVEPAVSLAANETLKLTHDLLTPRILHDSDSVVPLRTKNESLSSSTASSEERVTVVTLPGNDGNAAPLLLSGGTGNSAGTNRNEGNVVTTLEEAGNSYAPTVALPVVAASSESPVVPAAAVVTLNSAELAKSHGRTNMSLDDGDSQNATRNVNATVTQVTGLNNGFTHRWAPGNGTAVGGNAVEDVPTAFSKCASGQYTSL
jgi:hypothetical protein